MESQLVQGFMEATSSEVFGEGNYKLVPWISWDDWNIVRESLFSSSPASIDLALQRISAWRSRGCLPVMIEVTASIVEIQQKDSSFRDGLLENDMPAEEMLTMLYCMTIMRLVNGIVEKTRKKNEFSIADAAYVLGIPRMLIDIRHECSHRDLPSLRLVRLASTKALGWLKSYYWEPQKMAIPHASDMTAKFRKEIKSNIRELVFSLDAEQTIRSSSSPVKGKCIKHSEHLCGRSKFLSLMAAKSQSSKPSGSKKHIRKTLKNLVKLYSSFSSEVVSILLEFLLKALEPVETVTRFDDWRPLVIKLSNKEPEMLLSLLKALLQMIEAQESQKHNSGEEHLNPKHKSRFHQTEHLSHLFEWLVGTLKDLKPYRRKTTIPPKEKSLPKSTLVNLLRKCLMVSLPGNDHLKSAALLLAQMATNNPMHMKLNKLLASYNTSNISEISFVDPSESFYNHQEDSLRQASKKLEFFKQKITQKSGLKTEEKNDSKWSVVKSWKPCPIGMLPSDLGSSGRFPVLDFVDHKDHHEVNEGRNKRKADCVVEILGDSDVKKPRENGFNELGGSGWLMIGGAWRRVAEDELKNIALSVRVLV